MNIGDNHHYYYCKFPNTAVLSTFATHTHTNGVNHNVNPQCKHGHMHAGLYLVRFLVNWPVLLCTNLATINTACLLFSQAQRITLLIVRKY